MCEKLQLEVGAEVPWIGLEQVHSTNKGDMFHCRWSTRDGWIIYEAVERNDNDVAVFYVLVLRFNDKIYAIVEMTSEDDFHSAQDKVEAAKEEARSRRR